ncbi:MAG: DEAD/DEAH box helicase family protein, partial [Candidatus Cloacimonetes bacterium]|nr:DEAD/DEAH box helicase family protein [Candidatus Cloacimonadota bacterium]
MKYRFRALDYQTKAVDSIIEVFKNQGSEGNDIFTIDDSVMITEESYANKKISLSEESLLSNIKAIQGRNNIIETVGLKTKTENETLSTSTKKLKTEKTPFLELDIEMETGTGKTYVYTRTIFELNRQYGWKKFIVIVPSIAIREGVKKSFEMTTEHFKEVYKKQASYFIYNSDNISSVRSFCMDEDISVMIINNQAFSRDFEDTDDIKKRSKLKIFQKLDKNMGRSLIEDIARVRPILILDEPQRLQGKGTQRGLALFQPLLILNFSATLTKVTNLL